MFTQKEMTAQEFIRFAEQHPDKRFDFVDGEVVEVSPKPIHGRIQAAFTTGLTLYTEQNPIGVVYTEVLHVLDGKKFIPDVCINIPRTRVLLPCRRLSLLKSGLPIKAKPLSARRCWITSSAA